MGVAAENRDFHEPAVISCVELCGVVEGESSNKKQPESPMNIFAFCGEAQKSTERNPGKHCPQPPVTGDGCLDLVVGLLKER